MSARSADTCELRALRPLLVKESQVVRRPAWVPFWLNRIDHNYTQRARRAEWHRFQGEAVSASA